VQFILDISTTFVVYNLHRCTAETCMISMCIFRYVQDRVRVSIEFVGHLHWDMIRGLVLRATE
jgi:hypothetical protein